MLKVYSKISSALRNLLICDVCVWLQSSVIEMLLDNDEETACEVYDDTDSPSLQPDNVSVKYTV